MMPMDLQPVLLTFQLAALTTMILFLLGMPLAYWLAMSRSRYRQIVQTLVSMPLILPPVVLGFYLLLLFSPESYLGSFLEKFFHIRLVFNFPGIVLGSVLFNLPFMVQPMQSGFSAIPKSVIEASWTLGKSTLETLFRVILPMSQNAILTAMALTLAHSMGEFGVVLMMGGNIPGETRVASIAIYNAVESLDYKAAHIYSLILFFSSFIILLLIFSLGTSKTFVLRGKNID